jgi:FMN-dependent oxidoreductase (nitrilotriacetate monooxygenase family)
MTSPRQLHLNAFLMEAGHHEAAWRLPESNPNADFDLEHWIRLAQLAESAKFDSLFLADGPTLQGTGEFRSPGQLEPLTLLTALAAVTEHIGLIATVSTTYNEPYNLARRLASVDHVSGGRAGWNIVTSATAEEAGNFGLDERPLHADRYARADEFLDVVTKLWDSWADGALVADKAAGRWADPSLIRPIDHRGAHFRVAGGLNVPRPPQGYPLLVQAGASDAGRSFAATYAEAIFTAHQTLDNAQSFYADLKARVRAVGRDPDQVIVLPGIVPIIGSTESEARALAQELDDLRIPEYGLRALATVLEVEPTDLALDEELPRHVVERPRREGFVSRADLIIDFATRERLTVRQVLSRLGGGRGHNVLVGTPEQVVDLMITWFDEGAADGFNVMGAALPSGLEAFIEHVLPTLRDKGLFREEYDGRTLRDNYGLPRPGNRFDAVDRDPGGDLRSA